MIKQDNDQLRETASLLIKELGETTEESRSGIYRIVKLLGNETSLELLEQARKIHEQGMTTLDGTRQRTFGGVWFRLAKGKMTGAQRFYFLRPEKKQRGLIPEPFVWKDRIDAIQEADTQKGSINTVKITLVGRPGKIVDRGTCIVTIMESCLTPNLPKGLPAPTPAPTKYAVYIATKQWRKVKDAIADPEDVLIVEGYPKTDPEAKAIAVFATSVTTRKKKQQNEKKAG